MKTLCIALLLPIMLSACGEGYVLEPGRICLNVDGQASRDRVFEEVSRLLKGEGFEDLGSDDEMIDLIKGGSMTADLKDERITRLRREYTYLNDKRGLRVVVTDYSGTDLTTVQLPYRAPFKSFLELAVYESRPGGFSPDGHVFFRKILTNLQTTLPSDVAIISEPPPTDEAEYRRISSINRVSAILSWCVALSLSLLLIGFPTYLVTKKLPVSLATKRVLFTLLCAWLVTPVPLPAALTVIPGPNIFLFPWIDVNYYKQWGWFVPGSLVVTLIMCAAIAILGFRSPQIFQDTTRVQA